MRALVVSLFVVLFIPGLFSCTRKSSDPLDVDQGFSFSKGFPLDPGREGRKFIAGIESDHDGIRDDVQRWIYARYPHDEKKRKARLRYPIAYFQPAVMLEYEVYYDLPPNDEADLNILIHASKEGRDLSGMDLEKGKQGFHIEKSFVSCFNLQIGDTPITAETLLGGSKQHLFTFKIWPEGHVNLAKEKAIERKILAKRYGTQRWDVGVIHTKPGRGKEPLDVQVEIYPEPRLRLGFDKS